MDAFLGGFLFQIIILNEKLVEGSFMGGELYQTKWQGFEWEWVE